MMDMASVTVIGNVVFDPVVQGSGNTERVKLRVVANHRRRDNSTGAWLDNGEYGVDVVCWRQLARGVAASVRKGDPVVVIGRIATSSYEQDGERKYHTEVDAQVCSHDLSKGSSRYSRWARDSVTASETSQTADGDAADPYAPEGGYDGDAAGSDPRDEPAF